MPDTKPTKEVTMAIAETLLTSPWQLAVATLFLLWVYDKKVPKRGVWLRAVMVVFALAVYYVLPLEGEVQPEVCRFLGILMLVLALIAAFFRLAWYTVCRLTGVCTCRIGAGGRMFSVFNDCPLHRHLLKKEVA